MVLGRGDLCWGVGLVTAVLQLASADGVVRLELEHVSVDAGTRRLMTHIESGMAARESVRTQLLRGEPLSRDLQRRAQEGASNTSQHVIQQPINTRDFTIYTGKVEIGTTKQSFTMLIDTGSSDVWVPAANCSTTCAGKRNYDPRLSKSFQWVGGAFNATYLSGAVRGYWSQDDVVIGGMTVPDYRFGAVTSAAGLATYNTLPYDGVLGLNYASLDTSGEPTFISTLVKKGIIDQALVGLHMPAPGVSGELSLGQVNKQRYTGDLVWTDMVNESEHWVLPLDHVKVGDNATEFSAAKTALLDSGASYMVGPSDEVARMMTLLNGEPRSPPSTLIYKLKDCHSVPPPLTFVINGHNFTLKGEDYMWYSQADPHDCIIGVMSMYMSQPVWILGIPFMSTYYTALDATNSRIGLAPLIRTPPGTSTSQTGPWQTAEMSQMGAL